jgi:2-keto-4-pentenoate hydratase/2-oxohepta-3-ene-1,7-dioic acid hydratase in catechol pathway
MTYARFEHGGRVTYGTVDIGAGLVRPIDGTPFENAGKPGSPVPLGAVRLLAPCVPSKIFALAHNVRSHLHGAAEPSEPQVFLKVPSSVIATGETIVLPQGQGRVDEEAEVVVVMGRKCRSVSARDAMEYVLGFTCGNDVSARAWQKRDLNWWRAKSSDTFAPVGPWIVTGLDPATLTVSGHVNGREVQGCALRDLIFDIPTLISWISASVTLEPGDMIYTGTSGDTAELHDGDVVEVRIEGVGSLKNPVRQG